MRFDCPPHLLYISLRMTNQENELTKPTKKGFLAQTDEWFGRRHRIWYFISGFGLGFLALWAVYSEIIAPINQDVFNSEVLKYNDQAREMHKHIRALDHEKLVLEDSLIRVTTLGIDYGNYIIVRHQKPVRLLANKVELNYLSGNSLDIQIDTLGRVGNRSELTAAFRVQPCKNCIIPLNYGSFSFSLYCIDLKVDTVIIRVFKTP